jgi:putative membrane protein
MGILINWLISALAIGISAYLIPGVYIDGFVTALVLAVVIGIINITLKPILFFLTLPITILTLGLFALIINALVILLASAIVPGFQIQSFFTAVVFSIVLSLVNLILNRLVHD